MKKFFLSVLGVIVSIITIYFILKKVSIQQSWQEVQKVAFWQVGLLMLVYLLSFLPRAYRWKLMLNHETNIKLAKYFKATIVGFAGNNFLPARAGELLRMEFFSRETKVSRITALASVLTEKILDGLVLLLFIIAGIACSNSDVKTSSWLNNLVIFASTLFLGALLFITLFKYKRKQIDSFLARKKHRSFYNKLLDFHNKIQSALTFLKFGRETPYIIINSLMVWLIEASVFALALLFLEIEVEIIAAAFLLLSIVNFGILIPSSPAYLGVFQAMAILSLSLFNVKETNALTVGILVHFCQFIPVSILGGLLLIVRILR